jgi:hypothetical protein
VNDNKKIVVTLGHYIVVLSSNSSPLGSLQIFRLRDEEPVQTGVNLKNKTYAAYVHYSVSLFAFIIYYD